MMTTSLRYCNLMQTLNHCQNWANSHVNKTRDTAVTSRFCLCSLKRNRYHLKKTGQVKQIFVKSLYALDGMNKADAIKGIERF